MERYELNLNGPWEEVKEKLKEIHNELTDEDLYYRPGQEKQLLQRLSRKLGKDIPAIKIWIESVSSNSGIAS
jgi:dihydroorotase